MVLDGQKVRMDGQKEWTDGRTQGQRQNNSPPTSSGDKKIWYMYHGFVLKFVFLVITRNLNLSLQILTGFRSQTGGK